MKERKIYIEVWNHAGVIATSDPIVIVEYPAMAINDPDAEDMTQPLLDFLREPGTVIYPGDTIKIVEQDG
jgi:hypothetical protein